MSYLFIVSLDIDPKTKRVDKKIIKVIETRNIYTGMFFTQDLINLLTETGSTTNMCKKDDIRTTEGRDVFSAFIDGKYYSDLISVNDKDLIGVFDTNLEKSYVKSFASINIYKECYLT
jgi:hypothetical protein